MVLGLIPIRGPAAAPQAGLVAETTAGVADASEGKANWDPVSNSRLAGAWDLVLEGIESARDGNGSGAPSSSCLFYN